MLAKWQEFPVVSKLWDLMYSMVTAAHNTVCTAESCSESNLSLITTHKEQVIMGGDAGGPALLWELSQNV